jgi:anti-anti-sigma factor
MAEEDMEITEEKKGDVKVVVLRGRLDASTSPVLEKRIQTLLDQGESRLVFDFSELIYISSLGLRVLIMAAKSLQKKNGKLGFAALNETIYGVFKIAGFTSVFSIYPTLEEAIQHCTN